MESKPIWKLIKKQRSELADFLGSLKEEEWNTPSLSAGWRVRDVAAHLILTSRYTRLDSIKSLMRHGFNLNKFMYSYAKRLGRKPARELVAMLREDAGKQITPAFTKPIGVLADLLIHEQDIRVALGKEKELDKKALQHVLDQLNDKGFGLGEFLVGTGKNMKGLRFVATDLKWEKGGSDLIVEGLAQDLLVAIAGRQEVLPKLQGTGVSVLSARITKPGTVPIR